MGQKVFLTAEWRKLIMANYVVAPSLLQPFLPAGTELDQYNNKCFISLVGFMFKKVKVKGFSIPWHRHFPEINLRFYVKHFENGQWKRGVVFISEIVPKHAITFVANTLYNEHYITMPVKYDWIEEENELLVCYQWKKGGRWNKLQVVSETVATSLVINSEEEFITEHFWGYSAISLNKTAAYQVSHPRWEIYKVNEYMIDCDFETLYGTKFSFLNKEKPVSVFLAEGSPVSIFPKQVL